MACSSCAKAAAAAKAKAAAGRVNSGGAAPKKSLDVVGFSTRGVMYLNGQKVECTCGKNSYACFDGVDKVYQEIISGEFEAPEVETPDTELPIVEEPVVEEVISEDNTTQVEEETV